MGLIKAFTGAISGTFADQWKDIITVNPFTEQTVVMPGVLKSNSTANNHGTEGIITNGSKIFVPENTAAFIMNQSGIEEVITETGGYEYTNGQESVLNGDGIKASIIDQTKDRFKFGGVSADYKKILFVNSREIRDIKFGTKGPLMYNDLFYGTDLEIKSFGTLTLKVTNPTLFIQNYVPANTDYYSFSEPKAKSQIVAEFLQSFIVALNSLSKTYRISELPAQATNIATAISNDPTNAGSWEERFGFKIVKVAIENIEFSDDSKALVQQFNTNKMNLKAYEDVSQKASNIAAQQKIAEGVKDNGLGNAGGMVFGMNMAQGLNSSNAQQSQSMSLDQQIESLKKLKELLDAGILTQEEFDQKKKEIMGL